MEEHTQLIMELSFVLKSKVIHQMEPRKNKKRVNKEKRAKYSIYHRIYVRSNWVSGK